MRFLRATALAAILAAVLVSAAAALDIDEDSQSPLDAVVGQTYSHMFTATGGCIPRKFYVINGNLPPGLVLQTSGEITGVPTESGVFSFWIDCADNCGFHTQEQITLRVLPQLLVANASLPSAEVGVPYSVKITTNIAASVKWAVSAGVLPNGLTLAEDGTIAGTPTAAGSFTFTVKGIDTANWQRQPTKAFTVNVVTPFAYAPAALPSAEVGQPFTATLAATGGLTPYAWLVASGTLPPGLALDSANGVITGVPSAAGTFAFKIEVRDAEGRLAPTDLALKVAAKLAISTKSLVAAKVGHLYRAKVAARGGIRPLTWQLDGGTLPAGIRLSTKTGQLAGAAKKSGRYRFTVRVYEALGSSAVRTYVLIVKS